MNHRLYAYMEVVDQLNLHTCMGRACMLNVQIFEYGSLATLPLMISVHALKYDRIAFSTAVASPLCNH